MPQAQHKTCPLCGDHELAGMARYDHAHLCRCRACGFVFARSIPDEDTLARHYEGYGRDDYLSPHTIASYNKLLDEMEAYRQRNRILDVGCGVGYFLEQAAKRGWRVYGTEFTKKAVDICLSKGINMERGALQEGMFDDGFFDVVTSFEVIEHINHPVRDVAQAARLLRAGGLMYVTTPNFNALLRRRLKEKYNVITYPEHLCYYTASTLSRLFRQGGFQVQRVRTTGYSFTRARTSLGRSDESFIARDNKDERVRDAIGQSGFLSLMKGVANQLLTWTRSGDTLKGWFVKA